MRCAPSSPSSTSLICSRRHALAVFAALPAATLLASVPALATVHTAEEGAGTTVTTTGSGLQFYEFNGGSGDVVAKALSGQRVVFDYTSAFVARS
jgi:hypothetical protein